MSFLKSNSVNRNDPDDLDQQDGVFYRGAGRGDALEILCDAGLRGGLVALTGPAGAGVSTLLGEAAMRLLDHGAVVRVDGAQTPSRNALLSALLGYFGVAKEDFAATLERALASEPLMLIIDNGEQLGGEAIATLGVLRERLGAGFAVILGGYPEMVARIEAADLTITDDLPLQPLSEDQAIEFLDVVAGATLSEDEVAALFDDVLDDDLNDDAGVWPATLLAALPPPTLRSNNPLADFQMPWKHLAAVGGLALVLIILWPRGDKADEDVRSLALPVREVPQTVTADAPAPSPAGAVSQSGAQEPQAAPALPAEQSPQAQPEPEPEPEPEPAPEPEPDVPETAPDAPTVVRADQSPAMSGLDAELGYRRDEWLLTAPADHWMLQVTLASSEDSARALADRLGVERSAYYRARRNERNVFIVLFGPFESRTAATEGRGQLPADLAAAGPFPRQISTIQDEMASRAD
ncbi:SPOR domain-containing protein [Alcanivorax sp. JB21]|uniref:SPOR domain-containing protein n=1 Tax=Alcanivorax limicola TaxID=2874102 RepID=UPI001CC16F07|nr:SPOR domain-containing protein [Alcanivorax limicola]MBZ2189302.1 SPOR domain-containing protein [Alcanivorax limicola]